MPTWHSLVPPFPPPSSSSAPASLVWQGGGDSGRIKPPFVLGNKARQAQSWACLFYSTDAVQLAKTEYSQENQLIINMISIMKGGLIGDQH